MRGNRLRSTSTAQSAAPDAARETPPATTLINEVSVAAAEPLSVARRTYTPGACGSVSEKSPTDALAIRRHRNREILAPRIFSRPTSSA